MHFQTPVDLEGQQGKTELITLSCRLSEKEKKGKDRSEDVHGFDYCFPFFVFEMIGMKNMNLSRRFLNLHDEMRVRRISFAEDSFCHHYLDVRTP